MTNLVRRFVSYIEGGDLIPIILLVSIPHYVDVLRGYDYWYVAVPIGFVLDVGQFRSIKAFIRGGSLAWVSILTVASLAFHTWFYSLRGAGWASIILGLVPVVLIAFLAYLSRKERLDVKLARSVLPHPARAPVPPKDGDYLVTGPVTKSLSPKRMTYSDYVALSQSRDGNGPIEPAELMGMGVARATAYRWHGRYQSERPE